MRFGTLIYMTGYATAHIVFVPLINLKLQQTNEYMAKLTGRSLHQYNSCVPATL